MTAGRIAKRIRPALITGGAGFIGCNLADRLAREGQNVLILDSLERPGVERNLEWLRRRHPRLIAAVRADVRSQDAVTEAASNAAVIFHFAAQVAVTSSLEDPHADFAVNAGGTLNLLEAARRADNVPVIVASTNKVYGNLAEIPLERGADCYLPRDSKLAATGIGEGRPLDFHTPYGCSKGTADQYALDYARSFGLPTVVFRMSCIYGPRQMGTEDQGWVAHFARCAAADQLISIYGDGRQVRDLLFVDDVVEAYIAAWRRIDQVKGSAFNLGGGPHNAVSLLQVIEHLERLLDRSISVEFFDWRAGDQRYYVSDPSLARQKLGLQPPLGWRQGVAKLTRWLQADEGVRLSAPAEFDRARRWHEGGARQSQMEVRAQHIFRLP